MHAGGRGLEIEFDLVDHFALWDALPAGAYYDPALGEFILPYDAVRTSDDPDARLLELLQSSYEAAAVLGRWDRPATGHWHAEPEHPLVRSYEPGENSWWCYADGLAFDIDRAPPRTVAHLTRLRGR
jgi:hypothetical protein